MNGYPLLNRTRHYILVKCKNNKDKRVFIFGTKTDRKTKHTIESCAILIS